MARTTERNYRFQLHGFSEIARMTPGQWEETCRRNGTDMRPHQDDLAAEEHELARRTKCTD
jgi:hypothetical protein